MRTMQSSTWMARNLFSNLFSAPVRQELCMYPRGGQGSASANHVTPKVQHVAPTSQTCDSRVYLNVPFEDKEEAKSFDVSTFYEKSGIFHKANRWKISRNGVDIQSLKLWSNITQPRNLPQPRRSRTPYTWATAEITFLWASQPQAQQKGPHQGNTPSSDQ